MLPLIYSQFLNIKFNYPILKNEQGTSETALSYENKKWNDS